MEEILLKLCAVTLLILTQIVAKDVSKKESVDVISDEEAAAKCDWDISFISNAKTRTEICDVYCIMIYNGHDFPNEDGVFPPREERFRQCVAWSNVAGYPGICSQVHDHMRCVIKVKYGWQEFGGEKKTVFIPLIEELLQKG